MLYKFDNIYNIVKNVPGSLSRTEPDDSDSDTHPADSISGPDHDPGPGTATIKGYPGHQVRPHRNGPKARIAAKVIRGGVAELGCASTCNLITPVGNISTMPYSKSKAKLGEFQKKI